MRSTRRETFGDLLSEMGRFQEELNRVFGRFVPESARAFFTGTGPLVNVWEDEEALYAEADLPGVKLENLEIFVTEGNQLTVQGERPEGDWGNAVWHRQERGSGQFARTVALPALVDADKVEARYELGVLRLTLPKSEAAKPRRISVTA
jgi:HSP20 family protein